MATKKAGRYPAQIIGTEQKLSRTPETSPSADPKSGQFQMVGTRVDLSRTPTPSPTSNPKSGEFQLVGTQVSLNKTAVHGIVGVQQTPNSPVVLRQSNNAAERKG